MTGARPRSPRAADRRWVVRRRRGRTCRRDVAVAALLLCACPTDPASASAQGRRIVSLGAAVTETVIALGAGADLVGMDTTSEAPVGMEEVARVGYLRALGAEGLLSLSPTLVLVSDEAGPASVLDQVRAAGVACEVVAVPPAAAAAGQGGLDVAGLAKETIRRVASLLHEEERGEAMVKSLDADLARVAREVAARSPRPAALFVVHPPRAGAPLVAGQGTPADAMLALAGARNVAADVQGYRPLTPEAAVAAAPEVLVVPRSRGGAAALLEAAGLAATPAATHGRVVEVDAWMLAAGPRTGLAAEALFDLLGEAPEVSAERGGVDGSGDVREGERDRAADTGR